MKKLLLVLLLTPMAAFAQQAPAQQSPMTQEQAIMMEFAQATVMQTMCLVYYERTEQVEKALTYSLAPFVHAEEHGIPKEFVLQVVSQIYPSINEEWDNLPDEQRANIPVLCDDNYVAIKGLVDAWLDRQAEPESEPVEIDPIPGAVVI